MRFVLIDGSPSGSSAVTADLIQRYLPCIKGNEYGILYARDADHEKDIHVLNAADASILFCPVYNGGVSDQMLAFMSHLLTYGAVKVLPAAVYLHTDLYDPQACRQAMSFMHSWMKRMNWKDKIGIALGGDRLILHARSSETAETFCARIDRTMAAHADVFAKGRQEDVYIRPPVPKIIYNYMAERWMKETNVTKENNLQK